jgi:hypothetical protein
MNERDLNERDSGQSFPFGFALVATATAALYVMMLMEGLTVQTGGGEAAMASGFELLFVTAGLWLALTLLLMIGGLMGQMPRAAALAAIPLVPASAVAALVALDMCSRHMRWAAFFPATLAALLAFYAAWARFPQWRAALPARATSLWVWGAVLVLSAAAYASAAIW